MAINNTNDNLDKKIDKLINAMELLVDAVERGKGDSGYMSGSRFARRIKDGGNDYLYDTFDELTYDYADVLRKKFKEEVKKLEQRLKEIDDELFDPSLTQKEIDELHKKANRVRKEKKKAEKKIHRLNTDANYAENYYNNNERPDSEKNLNEAWSKLRDKSAYRDINDFKESKRREYAYHNKSNERDELRRRLANSGLGDTAFGRYGQKMFDRQQRAADLGNFANYLGHGGASKFSSMFGGGAAGMKAAAGLGKFAKGLGVASKMLGGPWMQALMIAIDGLKLIGDIVGEYKKFNADMINHQMQRENLQYENAKQTAILQNEGAIEDVKYAGDLQLKMMEIQSQNLIDAVKLSNDQYLNSVQTAVGPMMQGINAAAYQAAENSISASAQYQRNLAQKETREQKAKRYVEQRGLEYEGAKASLQAEQNIANVSYATKSSENDLSQEQARSGNWKRSLISTFTSNSPSRVKSDLEYGGMTATTSKDTNGGTINPATGNPYVNPGRWDNNGIGTDFINLGRDIFMPGLAEGVKAEAMATLKATNQTLNNAADWDKTNIDNIYKLELEKKRIAVDVADTQMDAAQSIIDANINAAETIDKTWLKLAQHIEQFLDKADVATNNTSLSMGYTNKGQMQSFQKVLMKQARDVATQYGKKLEDVTNAQNAYIEATGRNKTLGEHDYGQLFGLGKYLGDDNLAAQYGSEMEIFNHGIEDGVDLLDDVLQDVNRIGLNGRKYTKDLVNNMKLATKYNFKGGTKELMEMAKWAQQTRFNLSSLNSMIDKVQEGGIEGVITQSAGFQVLGGNAAINSDPLGMLYDAWGDPQAYAKRMQDMTKGFGRFDAKTGETKFNINESMQIAQMAKLQGRSAEELRQEIMQRNKSEQVGRQLSSYQNFDDEQKALISNKAEYKDGRWVVKMKNGGPKDVSQLSESDLDELMPTDHNERMEDYMKELIPLVERLGGETERENLDQGLESIENYWNEYADRLKKAQDSYEKNRDEYNKKIKENMELATTSFSNYMEIFKNGNEAVDDASEKIKVQANAIGDALAETVRIINDANAKIGINYGGSRVSEPSKPTVTNVSTRHDTAPQYIEKPSSNRVNAAPLDTINSYSLQNWSKSNGGVNTPYQYNPDTGLFNTPWGNYTNMTPSRTGDALTSGDGKSMMVSAQNVTSVHDGTAQVVKTDPNDTALFAKSGGPFDKLFDGIFGRINTIYNEVINNGDETINRLYNSFVDEPVSLYGTSGKVSHFDTKNGETKFGSSLSQLAQISSLREGDYYDILNSIKYKRNVYDGSSLVSNRFGGDAVRSASTNSVSNVYDGSSLVSNRFGGDAIASPTEVQLTINGKIELAGQNGQSIDIMDTLRNNPMFVRQITEMIVLQMNNNTHGGRNELFHNRFSG